MTEAASIGAAATGFTQDLAEAEALVRRNALADAAKALVRREMQASAPSPEIGIEANLMGVAADFPGASDSVDGNGLALEHDWLTGLDHDLSQAGLDKSAACGIDDTALAEALAALRGAEDDATRAGRKDAQRVAVLLFKYQQASDAVLDQAGGWVRRAPGTIARMVHDPDRLRGFAAPDASAAPPPEHVARAAWIDAMLAHVDLERSFNGLAEAKAALPRLWRLLVSGSASGEAVLRAAAPMAMIAPDAASDPDLLQWKSPADWAAYNRRYGAGTTMRAVVRELRRTARVVALLQQFGTQPRAALAGDIAAARHRYAGDPAVLHRLAQAEPALYRDLAMLDGAASRPLHAVSVSIGIVAPHRHALAAQGPAGMAGVEPLARKLATLRWDGVPVLAHWSSLFEDGAGSGDQAAILLKAGVDCEIAQLLQRFGSTTVRPGYAAEATHLMFKYSGVTPANAHPRLGFQAILARYIGLRKGAPHDALPSWLRNALGEAGLDALDWDRLRAADWRAADGADWFLPEIADRIANDANAERLRQGILTCIQDSGIRAAAAGDDASPRAALQAFARCKAFLQRMLRASWEAETVRDGPRIGRLAGIADLILWGGLLGYAAATLDRGRQLSRDPAAPETWEAALTEGGGREIYADALFGAFARNVPVTGDPVSGPDFERRSLAASRAAWLAGGAEIGAVRARLSTLIPAANLWMTEEALDFVLLYRLQEAIDPGFVKRLGRAARTRNQGIGWLTPPDATRQ